MQHEKINRYIATVCEQIRWKKAHPRVAEEIENHLTDQAQAFMAEGMDAEKAVERAVAEMGDPLAVGAQFDRTHRPHAEWSVLLFTALAVLLGVAIQLLFAENFQSGGSGGYTILRPLIQVAVGFVCMGFTYWMDFTLVGKYPIRFYGGLLALLFLVYVMAPTSGVYIPAVSAAPFYLTGQVRWIPYLFLFFPVAFAGILYAMRGQGYRGILLSGFFWALPACLGMMSNNLVGTFYYSLTCLILLTYVLVKGGFSVNRLYGLCLVYIMSALVAGVIFMAWIFPVGYRLQRLEAFLDPFASPLSYGYLTIQVRNALQDTSWISAPWVLSDGSAAASFVNRIPRVNPDYLLTYITARFGLAALLGVVAFLLGFMGRLLYLAHKQKSVLGKWTALAVILAFSIQIPAYLLNNLGYPLLSSLPLPFIASGDWVTVVNMALMGILLSVFKSGRLVRDNPVLHRASKGKWVQITDGKLIITFREAKLG